MSPGNVYARFPQIYPSPSAGWGRILAEVNLKKS